MVFCQGNAVTCCWQSQKMPNHPCPKALLLGRALPRGWQLSWKSAVILIGTSPINHLFLKMAVLSWKSAMTPIGYSWRTHAFREQARCSFLQAAFLPRSSPSTLQKVIGQKSHKNLMFLSSRWEVLVFSGWAFFGLWSYCGRFGAVLFELEFSRNLSQQWASKSLLYQTRKHLVYCARVTFRE